MTRGLSCALRQLGPGQRSLGVCTRLLTDPSPGIRTTARLDGGTGPRANSYRVKVTFGTLPTTGTYDKPLTRGTWGHVPLLARRVPRSNGHRGYLEQHFAADVFEEDRPELSTSLATRCRRCKLMPLRGSFSACVHPCIRTAWRRAKIWPPASLVHRSPPVRSGSCQPP